MAGDSTIRTKDGGYRGNDSAIGTKDGNYRSVGSQGLTHCTSSKT